MNTWPGCVCYRSFRMPPQSYLVLGKTADGHSHDDRSPTRHPDGSRSPARHHLPGSCIHSRLRGGRQPSFLSYCLIFILCVDKLLQHQLPGGCGLAFTNSEKHFVLLWGFSGSLLYRAPENILISGMRFKCDCNLHKTFYFSI